jgi:hypothetical protein
MSKGSVRVVTITEKGTGDVVAELTVKISGSRTGAFFLDWFDASLLQLIRIYSSYAVSSKLIEGDD